VKVRAHLGVFLVCLGLIAVWTWPLARDPAHLVPDNTDPRLFSWVMISVFRNLLTRPGLLLHGSAFYPHGSSLTFAEPLVTPALLAGPLYGLLGNPYLAYNLTLLLFWAASGWAMYAVTHWVTRCHPAAAAAMLVFTLAPPRIQYAVEFQMEIMFGLPLAVYALVRYFETQRAWYLIAFLVTFWLQAIAVWYFAVILGSGLVVLALSYALRHWSGWKWRTVLASMAGMVVLGVALAPVAWPFFVTRAELGLARNAGDAVGRSADVLSYATTDGIWLEKLVRISHGHETSLFPGLVAYGLAGLAVVVWLGRARRARTAHGWPERLVALGIVASTLLGVLTVVGGGRIGIGSAWTRLPPLTVCGVALLGGLLLRDALAGWRRWRAGLATRRLTEAEWVSTLGAMGLLAWLLSLGPVVPVAGFATGSGLYAWLHPYVLPLQAIRGTTRFGLLVLLVVAFLAGLGVAWLWERWRGRRQRLAVAAAVLVALALDYAHTPARYQWIASWARPVDAVLRADPDDIAVLEWPLNRRAVDVDAMLRSVGHGKRVVNGFAGFALDFERELSGVLGESAPPFASPDARTALAQVYPLRYLVVRDPGRHHRPAGAALADLSAGFLRFRGSYGGDDLYEIVALPERGHVLERLVSYDLLVSRPLLRARVQPLETQVGIDQWVLVTLNGTPVARAPLDGVATLAALLTAPLQRAAPNVIEIEHDYRRGPTARGPEHRIGATGATSPVDVLVRSGGQPHGDVASIRIGMGETSANRRGYNVVALGPDGEFRGRAAFDTFADPAASARLGAWVRGLPAGTIVLGAVRDEASTRLGADAIQALATLGIRGDLRGRYRESHAFVGVKGAPPGSALEALGPRSVEIRVGQPAAPFGLELIEFALEPAARSR
jgi:hypothetical protein